MRHTRHRGLAAIAAVGVVALLAAGCSSSSDDDTSANGDEQITLKVSDFGIFGYKEAGLFDQYEADHPNVKIVESAEGDLGTYNTQLLQRLAAGSGAGDVVAIEEGTLTQFLDDPDTNFVNMLDYGAGDLQKNWLDWKWNQSLADDGNFQIGLGTDVGGLAMCYRRDLFKEAGLPTDRDAVSKLWPTWDDFIATGKQYMQNAPEGSSFIDSSTNTYNAILMQEAGDTTGYTYFDKDGNLAFDSNPAIKSAWDQATAMTDAGLSAKLKAFSPEWNAGFKNGAFATVACPAWMTGYIQGQAGDNNAGNWDIASVPGGGGNWGGSFLAVTKQSDHPEEAADLVKFLTSPESQLAVFQKVGNLPSAPSLYKDKALLDSKNEYFNNAPVGQIFVAGAAGLKPVTLGAKNQPVRDAVENDLRAVEQGQLSSQEGWDKASQDAQDAAG